MKLQNQAVINGKYVYHIAWKRARSYNAVPIWSRLAKNRLKILKFYIEAQVRNIKSKRTKYEVDHIIPLSHHKVCGLHVHQNLQVLTQEKNGQKSNTFHPYREIDGKKIYLEKVNESVKSPKIKKKYNRTKKNPTKLVKKRVKAKVRAPRRFVKRIKP